MSVQAVSAGYDMTGIVHELYLLTFDSANQRPCRLWLPPANVMTT